MAGLSLSELRRRGRSESGQGKYPIHTQFPGGRLPRLYAYTYLMYFLSYIRYYSVQHWHRCDYLVGRMDISISEFVSRASSPLIIRPRFGWASQVSCVLTCIPQVLCYVLLPTARTKYRYSVDLTRIATYYLERTFRWNACFCPYTGLAAISISSTNKTFISSNFRLYLTRPGSFSRTAVGWPNSSGLKVVRRTLY